MRRCGLSSSRHGYTLIEVLAVVVLLGLVFAAVAPALAARSERAGFDGFVSEMIELDGRARRVAQRSGGAMLEHTEAGLTLEEMDRGERVSAHSVPEGIAVQFDGAAVGIMFDAVGVTEDYGLIVTHGERAVTLRFNGRTGWVVREENAGG